MTDRDDRDRDEDPPALAARRHGRERRDDDADDPQLHSLRAVWLGMADEDPPERGLAELMAAARVKADEMAKPSLWQRITALLRRPAVLALASIMVLLGGAVLLGSHPKSAEAPAPTVAAEQRAQDQTAVVPTASTESASGSAGDIGGAPGAGEVAPEVPALIEAEPAADPAGQQFERAAVVPSPRPRGRDAKDSARDDDGRASDEGQVARGFATPPAEAASDAVVAQPTGTAGAKTSGVADATTGDAASARTGATAKAEDMPVAEPDVRLGAAARPARAPQYVAQAKSAAARGDCAAARVLMKRVAQDDAALYRKTIASDAALKKCVAR